MSWRWIIRGTCLGLLGLCFGLWGFSYCYYAGVGYGGRSSSFQCRLSSGTVRVELVPLPGPGLLQYVLGAAPPGAGFGWFAYWDAMPSDNRELTKDLYPALGFDLECALPHGVAQVPLWFLTGIFAVASWVVWRKTTTDEQRRGFPIGPLASRRENAGG